MRQWVSSKSDAARLAKQAQQDCQALIAEVKDVMRLLKLSQAAVGAALRSRLNQKRVSEWLCGEMVSAADQTDVEMRQWLSGKLVAARLAREEMVVEVASSVAQGRPARSRRPSQRRQQAEGDI
eukprot:COSAG04_NODE_1895_length_5286_cov_40.768074_3_plen_124_part_00